MSIYEAFLVREKERQRIKREGTSRAREIGEFWEGYSEGRIDGPGN